MKRPLLWLAVLGITAALISSYLGPLRNLRVDDVERARRLRVNRSTRVLAYPVDRDHPLVLSLRPDDTELRLLSNLVLHGEPSSSDAEITSATRYDYGLDCRFLDASGRTLWSGRYWERTHKTRIIDPARPLPLEEAFCDDPSLTVCDTRVTHVLVGHLVARGARRLEIRIDTAGDAGSETDSKASAPPQRRVLVRAMRLVELSEREAAQRWSRMGEDQRQALLEQLDAYEDDLLPERERNAIMRKRFELIAAEANEDGDHPSVPLYLTGLWREFHPVQEGLQRGELAGPNRSLAFNVVGPTNLWIEVAREPKQAVSSLPLGTGPPHGETPLLRIEGLREQGVFVSGTRPLAIDTTAHGLEAIHIPVPAGAATVLLEPVNFRCQIRVYTDQVRELDGVEVSRVLGPVGGDGRYLELVPDIALTRFYRADTQTGDARAVTAEVVHERGEAVTEVRLGVRRLLDPDASPAPQPIDLDLDLLGEDGSVLSTRRFTAAAEPSRLALAWQRGQTAQRVTKFMGFRLRCPRTVRRLRVRTAQPLLVAFYTRLRRFGALLRIPEDQPLSPEVASARVSNGHLKPPSWYYFRPLNAFALATGGREVDVRTQRRLFRPRRRKDAARLLAGAGTELEPLALDDNSFPRRIRVLEAKRSDHERTVVATRRTRWKLDAPARFEFRCRDPWQPRSSRPVVVELLCVPTHRPEVETATGPETRTLLQAWVDGRLRLEQELVADRTQALHLGPLTPGRHNLRVEMLRYDPQRGAFRPSEARHAGLALFLDQPVLEEDGSTRTGALYDERMYTSLEAGQELAFPFYRSHPHPERVFFAYIAPWSPELNAELGRDLLDVELVRSATGEVVLERIVSVATANKNERSLTPCFDGKPRGSVRRFSMPIDADLPAGRYEIRLRRRTPGVALVRATLSSDAPLEIGNGRFVHLNLRGPARLRVSVPQEALSRRGLERVRLVYRIQDTKEPAPLRAVVLEPREANDGEATCVLRLPEGLCTVSLTTLGDPLPLVCSIDRPFDGLPGREVLKRSPELDDLMWLELHPARRSEPWYRATPGAAVRYRIEAPEHLLAIDLRALCPPPVEGDPPAQLEVPLAVRFFDAEGALLAGRLRSVTLTADDAAWVAEHPEQTVFASSRLHALAPSGARWFELEPVSQTALIRVRNSSDERDVRYLWPRFDVVDERSPLRVRHAAVPPRRFFPLMPRGAHRLFDQDRLAFLVRSFPAIHEVEPPEPLTGSAVAVSLRGARTTLPVLEDAGTRAVSAWSSSLWTAIGPNKPVRIIVAASVEAEQADQPPVVRVMYDLSGPPPLEPLELWIDGRLRSRAVALERRGGLSAEDVQPGTHEIEVRGLPENAKLFVNRPPQGRETVRCVRRRTLHVADPEEVLSFNLERPEGGDLVIAGTLYLREPERADHQPVPALSISVTPTARVRGRLFSEKTDATRRVVAARGEPRAVFDLSRNAIETWRACPFVMPLKADLAPGRYEVRLRHEGVAPVLLHVTVIDPPRRVRETLRRKILRAEALR